LLKVWCAFSPIFHTARPFRRNITFFVATWSLPPFCILGGQVGLPCVQSRRAPLVVAMMRGWAGFSLPLLENRPSLLRGTPAVLLFSHPTPPARRTAFLPSDFSVFFSLHSPPDFSELVTTVPVLQRHHLPLLCRAFDFSVSPFFCHFPCQLRTRQLESIFAAGPGDGFFRRAVSYSFLLALLSFAVAGGKVLWDLSLPACFPRISGYFATEQFGRFLWPCPVPAMRSSPVFCLRSNRARSS